MPKYFPVTKTRTRTVIVNTSSDSVTSERLQYDLPETHPAPNEEAAAVVSVQESHPPPTEEGILGVLLVAEETHAASVEDVTGTQAIVVSEESHPPPASETAFDIYLRELHPAPTYKTTIDVEVLNESHPASVEDVTGTEAVVVAKETHPPPAEAITAAVVALSEEHAPSSDSNTIEVDVSFLWPNAAISTSGWASTGNMLDKQTATAANCSASSSGLAGTGLTEESTSSNFEVSVLDPELDDLDIDSVELLWGVGVTTSGIQVAAGRCEINYQYSLDNGSNWTTFFAQTAQNQSTSSTDITAAVAGDWQKIKDCRFRAIGTVYSGTGALSVTTTATWSSARLRILASKTY